MSVYLDASVLVAAFTVDDLSGRAEAYLKQPETFIVSEWAVLEFSAAVGRKVRERTMTKAEAERAFDALDQWISTNNLGVGTRQDDVDRAMKLVRSLEHNVLAPDALHIVAAQRVGAGLATLDRGMAKVAAAIGILSPTSDRRRVASQPSP